MTNLDLNLTDPNELAFDDLVRKHDLTHQYSDDSKWFHAGRKELEEIRKASGKIQPIRAAMIWDYWVNKRLAGNPTNLEAWSWFVYVQPPTMKKAP